MRIQTRTLISITAGIAIVAAMSFLSKKFIPSHTATLNNAPTTQQPTQQSNGANLTGTANSEISQASSPVNPRGAGPAPASISSAAQPPAAQNAAPVLPQPQCFVETFHHKPTAGHSDEEACSHHKNLIKLSHSNVNPAHLCVRVNGTPVKFVRNGSTSGGDEILIGSIAGPKAKITASYCVGKLTCAAVTQDNCTIPKDEFMDALQGEDADGGDVNAHWEGTEAAADANLNTEVKKELADIDEVNSDESDHGRAPASVVIFKDWINEEDAPACSKKQTS